MKKTFKNPFNDVKKLLDLFSQKINKFLWNLGKNAFLFIVIFILSGVVFVEILFYQYVMVVKMKGPEITSVPNQFKESTYQSVLKQWKIREDIFNDSSLNTFQDPFL